ncbi:uncharacterized protein LOC115792587 [Archocentrus centrarchus]|uniref:uncharacterized protein LOC115792587 n=1 Tax=Archocentrus centrarchus TaxID=63155 RepID=UPI0011EA09FE|nr:uncharacterized protein LOC115792587 [Archocentrus centrarchus]
MDCNVTAVVPLSVALLISICLNIIFCIKRRAALCRDAEGSCYPHTSEGETLSHNEGHYFHDLNHEDHRENPHNHNHHEQQENPIYGNISTDRRGSAEDCYEMMTTQRTRDCKKPSQADLNYASLDLKTAKKRRKKHRHQEGQSQGRNKFPEQLSVHHTPPLNTFLEVDADMDAHLPSRDTSTMVSHSSIYLNSQQIAQQTEEMEREKSLTLERENAGWSSIRRCEHDGNQQSEEINDEQQCGNGNVCAELSEVETIQSCTDPFVSNFSQDGHQHG